MQMLKYFIAGVCTSIYTPNIVNLHKIYHNKIFNVEANSIYTVQQCTVTIFTFKCGRNIFYLFAQGTGKFIIFILLLNVAGKI